MNLIIWLIVGGLIGWVASLIMGTNAQQGIFLNIIVGVIGAFLARTAIEESTQIVPGVGCREKRTPSVE